MQITPKKEDFESQSQAPDVISILEEVRKLIDITQKAKGQKDQVNNLKLLGHQRRSLNARRRNYDSSGKFVSTMTGPTDSVSRNMI